MNWTDETPQPEGKRFVMRHGGSLRGAYFNVSDGDGGVFRHFSLHTCGRADSDADTQKRTWPREAIAEARKILDDLEAELQSGA